MGSPTLWPRSNLGGWGRYTRPIGWRPTSQGASSPKERPRHLLGARVSFQHLLLLLRQHSLLLLLHHRNLLLVKKKKTAHFCQLPVTTGNRLSVTSLLGGAEVPAVSLPVQGPQLLVLPVPSASAAPSAGLKRPAPAVQYLRRPDGRLFQLVPVSQLTPVPLRPTGESHPLLFIKDSIPLTH